MHVLSPSDIVGPSPVTSNGTEITEIEDEAVEDLHYEHEHEQQQTDEESEHGRPEVSKGHKSPHES